jgi:hypothetical protein
LLHELGLSKFKKIFVEVDTAHPCAQLCAVYRLNPLTVT